MKQLKVKGVDDRGYSTFQSLFSDTHNVCTLLNSKVKEKGVNLIEDSPFFLPYSYW